MRRSDYIHKSEVTGWVPCDCEYYGTPPHGDFDGEYLARNGTHALCKKCWERLPE